MKRVVFCAAVFLLALVLGLSAFFVRGVFGPTIPPQRIIAIPPTMSYVEGVEIKSVRAVNDTFGMPELEVEIRNNTSREAIALLLCSADPRGATCIGAGAVLRAHGGQVAEGRTRPRTFTMAFPVPNLHAGRPLSLSAVVWKDGSVSGDTIRAKDFQRSMLNAPKPE